VKISLTLPTRLRAEADATAKDIGVSRSRLIRTALEEFLEERREKEATESINRDITKYGAGLNEEDDAWLAHKREQPRRVERRHEGER
jgi:Arc/MetJ-type ribon-helix-helix transcriptional regulator